MVGGAVELVVTALAVRDLARRPSSQVRGPKAGWVLSFVVQPFGPLAYFAMGRRPAD
jgi:Phospholipase_D-nuclease N-terminal